jgi:hypothetical protein
MPASAAHHLRKPVQIGDDVTVDRLVEREQRRLVR